MLRNGGTTPEGKDFGCFVWDIIEGLPKSVDTNAVFKSVTYLVGKPIDGKTIFDMCWRLAGNINLLSNGIAVPPYSSQASEEWVPVQITSAKKCKIKDKAAVLYHLRVLAGTPAGIIIRKSWTMKFCHYLAKSLGFTHSNKAMPFSNFTEFISMRMYVLLDPKLSSDGPSFDLTKHTASTVRWNKDILKLRFRISAPCPQGFTHKCCNCHIGFQTCPAACHLSDYESGYCENCGNESFFDPTSKSDFCVNCEG